MDSPRILMIIPYLPNEENVATVFANNIIHSLQTKTNPTIIWILQTPYQKFENTFEHIDIKPIQNYSDAHDMMQKEKPDLVIAESSFAYSSYPFTLAAKIKKIPVISYYHYGHNYNIEFFPESRNHIIRTKLKLFFSKSKFSSDQKKSRRGLFYLYKYMFYLKTLSSSNLGFKKLSSYFLESLWVNSFGIFNKKIDSRLISDKICLPHKNWIEPLTKAGFPRDSLVVTGSPIFDMYDISKIKPQKIKKNETIKILIVTQSYQSHGNVPEEIYSKKICDLIFEIQKNPKFEIAFKIHPTSETIEDYSKILNKSISKIPIFQQEKLSQILENYDIAISFGKFSGAHFDILMSGTPLITMTIFDNPEKTPVLKHNCSIRCDHISNLGDIINNLSTSPIPMKNIESFLHTVSNPLDGNASERFANEILLTLKK